jgi:hypothetical protein
LSTSVTYNGSATVPTDAGNYTVVATVTDPNYTGSDTETLAIAKAASTTTVSGGGTFTYDGSAHAATVSVTGVGGLNLTPDPEYSCGTAPINVAETPCTASYTYAGDANHEGSSDSTEITITKAAATVSLSDLSHVYDGTPKSATATTTPPELSVLITYDGEETIPSAPGSYAVVATVTDPNYSGEASDTMVIQAEHDVTLVAGWNLVSFAVHPESTAIADVLSSVADHYDLVYAWDGSGATSGNWLKYGPNDPEYTNSLTTLDETMGFWIHMTVGDTLEVIGDLPETTDIPIYDNADSWNLVGYPSASNGSLPAILSDHGVGTDFSLVFAYHANDTGDPWKLFDREGEVYANDLTELAPGWGYWLKANADHTWSVAY